uniref:Uncharacterized protein n=1 Tax=Panagrolaimus sp. ES5 TaxID=591445 RepID=A0AC34GN23_9BILA
MSLSCHKTENWTCTQIRQNLWDRKGLTLIQTQIRCPCKGGISLRDVDAWIRRENNTQKADKKRKTKKKTLPIVVTRVRCESEHAPQQYDPHEVDDYVDPALANHFSKIRLRNNSFNKASKKVSTFDLEKSPELEFPSINGRAYRRTTSLCEREGKKLSFPSSYNKVVSNEIQSKMNAFESIEKPVENLEHFEMSSPYFRFDWLNHKQNERNVDKMTAPRHYISKICDCESQSVITHSPTRISSKRTYDPKGDFVPLESVLDDYTETSKLNSCSSIKCCVHGAPCKSVSVFLFLVAQVSVSVALGQFFSECNNGSSTVGSRSEYDYDYLDSGSDRKGAYGNLKPRTPTSTDKAYENIRIDQISGPQFASYITKTRWPLTDLTAEYPPYSLTSVHQNNHNNNNQFQKKDIDSEKFYDFFSDGSNNKNGDTKSLGRRKDKKKKSLHEKYPHLESVLEDNGYIELKMTTSKESFPRSIEPKSSRRKNKKTLQNNKNKQLQKKNIDSESVYDSCSEHHYGSNKDDDADNLGRRRDKKKKCVHGK